MGLNTVYCTVFHLEIGWQKEHLSCKSAPIISKYTLFWGGEEEAGLMWGNSSKQCQSNKYDGPPYCRDKNARW